MRTAAINASLERTISKTRLEKYLAEKNEDLEAALSLYEYNTRVSESFYTSLQSVEICLRNTIDRCMTAAYGQDWFLNGKAPLRYEAQTEIAEAYAELGGPANIQPGAVVAKLKFSFWVGLLGTGYDSTIWRNALHKGFASTTGKKRSDVHGRFNYIRRFRNRVAHHEPIFQRDLTAVHREIIEAIGWMCKDTQNWTAHISRTLAVINTK